MKDKTLLERIRASIEQSGFNPALNMAGPTCFVGHARRVLGTQLPFGPHDMPQALTEELAQRMPTTNAICVYGTHELRAFGMNTSSAIEVIDEAIGRLA
jgi:hypothetical protein